MIEPVDSLEITVVVDNVTDSLSSTPKLVETEFAGAWRRGMKWLGGKCLCCAAHGLSCLITVRTGGASHSLLFDTGPDEWVFERNVVRLSLDLGQVGAMMLSHGHWDHAGAMPRALQLITLTNGGKSVPTYMHPDMFSPRAIVPPDGRLMPMEDIPSEQVLAGNGAQLVITRDEQSVLSGSFYISGEIARVTPFERGLPGQHRLNEDGKWELDELLMDERFVAVHIANKGLFVFTACSHAGLINVLTHGKQSLPRHTDLWRARWFSPGWPNRNHHTRYHRSAGQIQSGGDRRRALHRLEGDRRAGDAIWKSSCAFSGWKTFPAVKCTFRRNQLRTLPG